MAGSPLRIRKIADHGSRPRESHAAARAAARGRMPRATEGLSVADRLGENSRSGRGWRTPVRAGAGRAFREKRIGDARGAGPNRAKISAKQVERRRRDGGGQLL